MPEKINDRRPEYSPENAVEVRNGFKPPRYMIHRLEHDAWMNIPPIPLLTDPAGEEIRSGGARIQLAFDDNSLFLLASIDEKKPSVRRDLPQDSPEFWRQDHIELRLLKDPSRPAEQTQFIATPDGRFWDSTGLWKKSGAVLCKEIIGGDRWETRLQIPLDAVGIPNLKHDMVLKGIAAYTRWSGQFPHIACSSAVELGFSQSERFGDFVFCSEYSPLVLTDVSASCVKIMNCSDAAVGGVLRISQEDGDGISSATSTECSLRPGVNPIDFRMVPGRPLYTRYSFDFIAGDSLQHLGAISLRAPASPITLNCKLSHPYLLFDNGGLESIRSKIQLPPFAEYRKKLSPVIPELHDDVIPDEKDGNSLAVTKNCMNWFRVAKETMIRDGEGNRCPAARRIWTLQSEEAHDAWRGIAKSVTPTEAQISLLCSELNGLLADRDFYDAQDFGRIHLPEEAERMLSSGAADLSEAEVFRLNRIVLQSAVECILPFRMDLVHIPGSCFEKWVVSPDPDLISRATKSVKTALRLTIPGPEIHLHEGMAAGGLAIAYDSFHKHLASEDRVAWRRLMLRFLALYLRTARRRSWTCTTIANSNPVVNGGCGLLALAVLEEEPDIAREALHFSRNYIRLWLDYCNGADGGNTEGAQYWEYGMSNLLRFAYALERTTGSDDGLLSHPAIRNSMNMIRVGLCNDGALHGINDTVPVPVGGETAWFVANRYGDEFALWYGDHAARWFESRKTVGRDLPYGPNFFKMLLWRPDKPEQKIQPPLPAAFSLSSIEYGVIRSGERYDSIFVAGMKGSRPPYTHHNQTDTGALFVDLRGERLLIDPGYYKPDPTDHCLPLIGGTGPSQASGWNGTIVACEVRGAVRYLAVDSTAAYGGAARRVVRHMVMPGDEGIVILEDIDTASPITIQYQCGGIPQIRSGGAAIDVAGHDAILRMSWPGGPEHKMVLKPERSLHDTHWGYHFADCRMFPVEIQYASAPENPLVAVLQDASGHEPLPALVKRTQSGLSVAFPSGLELRFICSDGRWRF